MIYNNADILTTTIDSPFGAGKQYYKAKQFPIIPPADNDLYVVTVEGDRLDLLAYTYYQDASLWWVVLWANNIIDPFARPYAGDLINIVDIQSIKNLMR